MVSKIQWKPFWQFYPQNAVTGLGGKMVYTVMYLHRPYYKYNLLNGSFLSIVPTLALSSQ